MLQTAVSAIFTATATNTERDRPTLYCWILTGRGINYVRVQGYGALVEAKATTIFFNWLHELF